MNWLKEIREKAGLSQEAVAEAVSISQPSYSNIENGNRRPSVTTAMNIAKVLGFSWTRFFDDTAESA